MESLDFLREYFPKFKINLLASGGIAIPENKYPDNYAYCLHGWKHDHFDTVTEEQLQSWKYDKIYRAPYWELTDEMYERLIKNGYKVLLGLDDKREGIKYNWDIKDTPNLTKDFLFGHGHINYNVNWLPSCMENVLKLPRDTEFQFIRDL